MNKRIACLMLFVMVMLLFLAAPAFADQNCIIKLDDIYMSIFIPSDFAVLTRDTDPNDPDLQRLGFTGESWGSYYNKASMYLYAFDESTGNTVFVCMYDGPKGDFSLVDDSIIEELMPKIFEVYENQGMSLIRFEMFAQKQAKFVRTLFSKKNGESKSDVLQYYTVYNSKTITVTYNTYNGEIPAEAESMMNDAVNSIAFGETPEDLGQSVPLGESIFTDSAANVSFVIPDGWTMFDHSVKGTFTSADFITDKSAEFIMYTCTDVWNSLPMAAKKGSSREECGNSLFTIDNVAQMYGISAAHVSMVTYNGVEYFLCAADSAESGLEGENDGLIHCMRMDNGYKYTFTFAGPDTSICYRDFEALMNSVAYGGTAEQSQTYAVKRMNATVLAPEGYDVFSKDAPISSEVLAHHGMTQEQADMLTSMYSEDLWMVPMAEACYPTNFIIYVKVKEKETYQQVGDLRNWTEKDRKEIVDRFMDGFGTKKYTFYETDSALFYVFDWGLTGQQRYATIVDGKMLYIYSERRDGPLTALDREELKYVVDHFVIGQPGQSSL